MIAKIVDIKNPSLRTMSKKVGKIDKKVLSLITDMKETLLVQKDPEGVGLAAPQIGKNLRIFLIYYNNIDHIIINPEIISISDSKTIKPKARNNILEGCLSLPHFYGPIARAKKLTLKYTNIEGNEVVREFSGFLAHIIQHEVDHLNGVLFVDRILEQKVPLYKFDGDEWEEVDLP